MRVLFDVTHPAHVYLFKYVVARLRKEGHKVLITARQKDVTMQLLEGMGIPHLCISRIGSGMLDLGAEYVVRQVRLLRVARRFRPDVLVARIGITTGPVGALLGVPRVVFEDTEHATLQLYLSAPFATYICTGTGYYRDWGRRQVRFRGTPQLAYLDPRYFRPDPEPLRRAGVNPDEPYIVVRRISWKAGHDVGLSGVSDDELVQVVRRLSRFGRVLLSTHVEATLPETLESYRSPVPVEHLHDLMAFAALQIGEGGTTTAEAAVLGTPSILCNPLRVGYLLALEKEYGLAYNTSSFAEGLEIAEMLLGQEGLRHRWQEKRRRLLGESEDIVAFTIGMIEKAARRRPDLRRVWEAKRRAVLEDSEDVVEFQARIIQKAGARRRGRRPDVRTGHVRLHVPPCPDHPLGRPAGLAERSADAAPASGARRTGRWRMNATGPASRATGPPVFLISGGSLSGNKGAVAMTLVAADQLRAMAPDCHVRLLSTYPEEDAAIAEREGIELVPAPAARTATRTLARSAVAALFRWRPRGPLADDVIRAYAEADVLVDLSGISFSDDLPLRGWLAGVVWMMPALATRTPVVKLSQAMGPFGKRLNRWAARALLGRCAVLMARGQATADQVRALLGRRAACRVAADVAFLLEPAADDRVDAALDAAGAPADGYVGVSASSMVDDKTTAVGRSGAYRATMADLVTHIRATTGRAVVLVPHAAPQRAGLRADGEVCREVADALESRDGVFVLDELLDARVTKGVIGRSDVYVASRFHAMVAALGSGVPVLVVGWGHKYREVMEAFGLGSLVLDFASATDVELRQAFDELWGGREALRDQVGAARPAVLDSARENFRRLHAFLERRGLR